MLCFDRSDVSKEIEVNKTSKSKECNIFPHQYFINKLSKFQPYVCTKCHDLLMMSMNLSNIAFLNIKNADYCGIIIGIS